MNGALSGVLLAPIYCGLRALPSLLTALAGWCCSSHLEHYGCVARLDSNLTNRFVKVVKFLKPNKVVVILQGRFAGRKAVIVKSFEDRTKEWPYGHALVVGIANYPRKVIKKESAKTIAERSRLKVFIKIINYNHIMPTRYTLDVDLKNVATPEKLEGTSQKIEARKETKSIFEDRFKTGKNRWFFSKLRF